MPKRALVDAGILSPRRVDEVAGVALGTRSADAHPDGVHLMGRRNRSACRKSTALPRSIGERGPRADAKKHGWRPNRNSDASQTRVQFWTRSLLSVSQKPFCGQVCSAFARSETRISS